MAKFRLDQLLIGRGLFPTRAKAQAALLAGKVRVTGHQKPKAGLQLPPDAEVSILPDACPFVSRGGLKLAAALERFPLVVTGRVALDLGSSTGGFTDCLLQRGAARVYAVDVGTAQLDAKLRADPRVIVMERTHVRDLGPEVFDPRPSLCVADVSFISLARVLPHALACLKPGADLVVLVKPQFEVGPKKAPKGIVRDPAAREEALAKVRAAARALGLVELGRMESPVQGAKGNVEYLLHLRYP